MKGLCFIPFGSDRKYLLDQAISYILEHKEELKKIIVQDFDNAVCSGMIRFYFKERRKISNYIHDKCGIYNYTFSVSNDIKCQVSALLIETVNDL